jgi:hypothetical protein
MMGGAIVSSISLRRMGHAQKAKKVLWITAVSMIPVAIALILLPDSVGRIVGISLEAAWYGLYVNIQQKEFNAWQAAHIGLNPTNGWKAVGWGLLGTIALVVVFAIMVVVVTAAGLAPKQQ